LGNQPYTNNAMLDTAKAYSILVTSYPMNGEVTVNKQKYGVHTKKRRLSLAANITCIKSLGHQMLFVHLV
jgi:hypothetical protein